MSEFLTAMSAIPTSSKMCLLILLGCVIVYLIFNENHDINNINATEHRIKNGPYGDARFATDEELKKEYKVIEFNPTEWRKHPKKRPTEPGYLIGDWHEHAAKVNKKGDLPLYFKDGKWKGGTVKSYLCTRDTHVLLIASSGAGKTSFFLDAQIEYAMATGISFAVTDTKGDLDRQFRDIAKQYGYNVVLMDLRNPMRSSKFNILHMVSKYTKKFKECADPTSEEAMLYQSRRESYAKICAKTIINAGTSGDYGANAFFYDAAEGLLTACILLVCEYAKPEEQHIISVYKLIQALSGSSNSDGVSETEVKKLLDLLPPDSKIRMFAGSAAEGGGDSQASVMSTAMSRLISFLDSETEQILCFKSEIDAEEFCSQKTMLILTMPEENPTRFFMVSLVVQELYRELLTIADQHGGRVPGTEGFKGKTPRIVFFMDEFGTLPPIDSASMMFSAARSRNIFFVPIVQGTIQLEKNYKREGAKIIRDNCQLQMFTGIAPSSSDADEFSKMLGTYTAKGGSVSHPGNGKNNSKTDSMVSVNLMTADAIRTMNRGDFVVMRTGDHPIKCHFDLFLDWGIPPYKTSEARVAMKAQKVQYTSRDAIEAAIINERANQKVASLLTDSANNTTIFEEIEEQANKEMQEDAMHDAQINEEKRKTEEAKQEERNRTHDDDYD